MRLIDADLLKKNIAKWLQGGDPQETEMVKFDDIAVSVIMEIEKQPTVCDWIPCSEKLPECPKTNEDEKSYFVTVKRKSDGFTFTDKIVFHEYGWNVPSTCEVLAWQSLPEPYKPSKTDC